ncbi:hypothetical protein H0H92_000919 [Tricholoma furcatifolium]|nr:hypothetical protein H0H92_000919 [Tricholoma furcatifolium]
MDQDDEYGSYYEDLTEDDWQQIKSLENSSTHSLQSTRTAEASSLPAKRGPGRPKGSGKPKEQKEKRPVGRPRGTGPIQLAIASGEIEASQKRKPGRPKGVVKFGAAKSRSNGLFVRGIKPTGPSYRGLETSFEPPTRSVTPANPRSQPTTTTTISTTADVTLFPSDNILAQNKAAAPLSSQEDITYVFDTDDEAIEGKDTLLKEGIGDDDADGYDNDEESTGSSSTPPVLPRSLPNWLKTVFDAHVNASSDRSQNGLPSLYREHQTFWFPKQDTFFLLRNFSYTDLAPQKIYNPQFFLWDPECLVPGGIRCPNSGCSTKLQRHGHIPRPRRVVGLSKTFYIIGYRYRCMVCKTPASVTFQSWDRQILEALPRPLADAFPAKLSYRSGISTEVFDFMRTCFQNGMGALQFSNALLVQHLQYYDLLHLHYLHTLAGSLYSTKQFSHQFKSFLPFDDKSNDGLQGFVPSGQWLRNLYDTFIIQHSNELNQHTAMLTGKVCAIDHSFKLAKHIAKVDGIQIFTALLTVTNEKGEIRVCNLVATKSHSQFELALQRMRVSLELYGHSQPSIFYTDNTSDKEFLEKCFPSLKEDITPIEPHSHLDKLSIPDDVNVSVHQSVSSIDNAMRTILDGLPENDSDSPPIVIGLDAEWNVEVSQHGYVTGRGQTAVVQIAYGKNVFVLQIGQMLSGNQLPLILKQVLANPKIIKVGRCITGDLKYLQEACKSNVSFVGAVDVAKLAKDRLLISSARASLSDVCAAVLKLRLNKNVAVRVSDAWENTDLTTEQVRYAALDAYASLAVYNALITLSPPQLLSGNPQPGTPVLLFSNDNTRIVARGIISSHQTDTMFMDIKITPLRSVIDVHEVLVPGALISNGILPKKTLKSHGNAPFTIVCLQSHLRLPPSNEMPALSIATSPPVPSTHPLASNIDPEASSDIRSFNDGDTSSGFGDLLADISPISQDNNTSRHQTLRDSEPDPASQAEGERTLGSININGWSSLIRSRILKDPFHVFNMFYISASHGLLQEFATTLRDAMFIWDQTDKSRIEAWGRTQNPPQSFNDILFTRPKWLLKRCKRIIPPAEQLFPLVKNVFETYGPLRDAKSGLPLFNSAAWAVSKNILLLIQKGHLSDPPGIALYYQVGIEKKTGLPLFRCIRGTNMTEGGVHTHLRSRLPTSGVSICHVQCSLLDFIIRHNIVVGFFNSTGQRYIGHYSIWITNELQEMLSHVKPMLFDPPKMLGWVNGNLYQPTNEASGVLPIPLEAQTKSGMGSYIPSLHSAQRHHFLASMQGTRKPVLPVHNAKERELFCTLMASNSTFNDPITGRKWEAAVPIWNNEAEGLDELEEQLKAYFNGPWKRNTNIKQTKAMTAEVRMPLRMALRDPRRSSTAPQAPETTKTLHSALKGLSLDGLFFPTTTTRLTMIPAQQSSLPLVTDTSSASPPTVPSLQLHQEKATALACKRAAASIPEAPSKKRRKTRSCRKCGREGCSGNKEVKYCQNPCQDCSKVVCNGRNPKRPGKRCSVAWDD